MRLPAAIAPLRHPLFRLLWTANVVVSLGVWMQNTGAGWLMTTLSPNALSVSLVQAATIMPIFLLALPAGALADILDRRLFILATQGWMLLAAAALALLTYAGLTDPAVLLALTFAIGVGSASNSPAWGSVMIEAVPRQDLVQAVTLNSVGFNLARAVGPALAGVFLLFGGPALTFALNAVSYLAVIAALLSWHRRIRRSTLPREHFVSAVRAGMRFVRHTPAMRASMVRSAAYFAPAAAPWAMLPLVVREHLHLDAGFYGLLLGLMGTGGVAAGLLLPQIRRRLNRGNTVLVATLCSAAGMGLLALSHHWLVAAVAMLAFGVGWVSASSVAQGAAQLAAPPWVRSRALAIYQLASNGGLVVGTFVWGWLGTRIGLPATLLAASGSALVLGLPPKPSPPNSAPCSTQDAAACWKPSITASTPPSRRNFSPSWRKCVPCAAVPGRWSGNCMKISPMPTAGWKCGRWKAGPVICANPRAPRMPTAACWHARWPFIGTHHRRPRASSPWRRTVYPPPAPCRSPAEAAHARQG
jgi:MFS family permease